MDSSCPLYRLHQFTAQMKTETAVLQQRKSLIITRYTINRTGDFSQIHSLERSEARVLKDNLVGSRLENAAKCLGMK